ncbi:hypothetical protein MMC27_007601 [Xylographa pallens]|nr:hypothetical protein [Xylographa pallens]
MAATPPTCGGPGSEGYHIPSEPRNAEAVWEPENLKHWEVDHGAKPYTLPDDQSARSSLLFGSTLDDLEPGSTELGLPVVWRWLLVMQKKRPGFVVPDETDNVGLLRCLCRGSSELGAILKIAADTMVTNELRSFYGLDIRLLRFFSVDFSWQPWPPNTRQDKEQTGA